MRRLSLLFIVAIMLVAIWATPATADWETRTEEIVTVNKGEVTSGDLWCSGQRVVIEGTVNGDLLVAAQQVVVRGEVLGDIIGWATEMVVEGPVGGNIRLFGGTLRVSAPVQRNITAYCLLDITIDRTASAGGLWGTTAAFKGEGIIRDRLQVSAKRIDFGGEVHGEATLQAEDELKIRPGARIESLYYASPSELSEIKGAELGAVERIPLVDQRQKYAAIMWHWIWFLGTMLMGFFMVGLMPHRAMIWSNTHYGIRSFLRGFLLMAFVPIAIFFMAITGVGLPLALFIGLFYLLFILYSQLPFYLWLGRVFIRLFRIERNFSFFFLLIVGGLLMAFISTIPGVGVGANIIATAFGIGMLTQRSSMPGGHGMDVRSPAKPSGE